MQKSLEWWVALCVASLYVFHRSSDKPLLNRLTMTAVSAGLGYSLTPEVSAMTGRAELVTLVVLTSVGYLILDFLSALVADRSLLIETVRRILKK